MYKVFEVEGGYQIFWCPSEHRKEPLNKVHIYPHRTGAYRRVKQLNDKYEALLKETDKLIEEGGGAIIL